MNAVGMQFQVMVDDVGRGTSVNIYGNLNPNPKFIRARAIRRVLCSQLHKSLHDHADFLLMRAWPYATVPTYVSLYRSSRKQPSITRGSRTQVWTYNLPNSCPTCFKHMLGRRSKVVSSLFRVNMGLLWNLAEVC